MSARAPRARRGPPVALTETQRNEAAPTIVTSGSILAGESFMVTATVAPTS